MLVGLQCRSGTSEEGKIPCTYCKAKNGLLVFKFASYSLYPIPCAGSALRNLARTFCQISILSASMNIFNFFDALCILNCVSKKHNSLLSRPTSAQHTHTHTHTYIYIYKQYFIYRKYCYRFRCICIIFRES